MRPGMKVLSVGNATVEPDHDRATLELQTERGPVSVDIASRSLRSLFESTDDILGVLEARALRKEGRNRVPVRDAEGVNASAAVLPGRVVIKVKPRGSGALHRFALDATQARAFAKAILESSEEVEARRVLH